MVMLRFIICFFLLTVSDVSIGAEFLPVDEAFQLKEQIISPTELRLDWAIAPNYHLYSDSIAIKVLSPTGTQLEPLKLPQGKIGTDSNHAQGYMEYYHALHIPVQLAHGTTTGLELAVTYQGCADAGLCYPPQTKKISLSELSDDKLGDLIASSDDANRIDHLLQQQKMWVVLLCFFVFGLLLACTPCVFPMLPILSSIIARQGPHLTTSRAFIFSLIYVLSSAITYACAGIFAGLAGHHLQSALQNEWVISFSGVVFIILAMSLFGLYELQLPARWQNKLSHLSQAKKRGSLFGVVIMGVFSSLIVSPCVSAPLVGALAYVGSSGSAVVGGFALFVLGLGMGLPLLIIGTSAGKILPKSGHWMESIKKIFGVMLIAMAIWIWSRILPAEIILALFGILAITCAIYLGAFEAAAKGWPRVQKGIAFACGIYGVCLLIGAASGSENFFQPLDQLISWHKKENCLSSVPTGPLFVQIKNINQLKRAIKTHPNQATLADFSADWCASCQEMRRDVLNNPTVQKYFSINHIQLLQVDLTVSDPENQAILKAYEVIAPPTFILFNAQGEWLSQANIVGAQSPDAFLEALKKNI